MPLLKGSGSHIVSANVRELRNSGYPENQSIAIALQKAGKAKKRAKSPTPGPRLPSAGQIAMPKLPKLR